jgi:hypothetical protein
LEKDYNNYDYLSISVKNYQLDNVLTCYTSLGWKVIKRENDRKFFDMKYILLSRPHHVPEKDRLQYLQVRMETQINAISGAYTFRHTKSDAFLLFCCLVCTCLMALGIYFIIEKPFWTAVVMGSLIVVFSAFCGAGCVYPYKKMRQKEKNSCDERVLSGMNLIAKLVDEARAITSNKSEANSQSTNYKLLDKTNNNAGDAYEK